MNCRFSLVLAILFAIAFCGWTEAAKAQATSTNPAANQPMQSGQMDQSAAGARFTALGDTFIAQWVGADNQCEITLNEFASQRASNQDVKNFTQEMIRAHTDLAKKMEQTINRENTAVFGAGRSPYTVGYGGAEAAGGTTPGATQGTTPGTTLGTTQGSYQGTTQGAMQGTTQGAMQGAPTARTSQQWNPIVLKREIDGKLVSIVQQKLGEKKGEDFDRCFMHGQVAAHVHMLATLDVLKNQASPQLRPILDDAVKVAEQHLSHAESLFAKLEPQHHSR